MIVQKLTNAKAYIDYAIDLLNETPEKNALAELIQACKALDNYYKEYCDGIDEDRGESIGTTYNEGISMEFYIEAEAFHDISLALRKLI